MPRIEVAKSADGQTLIPISTPNGRLYVPQASLQPMRPSELRREAEKSADRRPLDNASVAEQFEQGSREMFGGEPEADPQELEPSGNDLLDSVFTNSQTVYAAEV